MKNPHSVRKWMLTADLGWLPVAMILAWLLRYTSAWHRQPVSIVQAFLLMLLGASLGWTILWSLLELDGFRGGWRFPAIVSHLLLAVTTVMGILMAGGYLLRVYVSRLALIYFGALMLSGFVLIRMGTRWILNSRFRSGAVRRVVIVGNGPLAREAAIKIERHLEMLCHVAGFLSLGDSPFDVLQPGRSDMVEVRTCSILDLLERNKVDELIFAVPRNGNSEIAELMDQCVKRGIAVSLIPQPYELYMSVPQLVDLDGLPILRLKHSAWTSSNPAWKRMLDLFLGALLLIPCLPVILVAAGVLKMKKGKGFCREERYGQHGKTFWMYRLNSPRRAELLPSSELFLQHLSLTELPQLFNVLRGDMSLVGPRPEGQDKVRHYTDWHLQRFKVQPGMTGLAQVHGLRDPNPLEDKTRYDLQYILRRSLFQDVSLLLQTIWTLLLRFRQTPLSEPQIAKTVPEPDAHPSTFAA
jgi:lipopolysaccharide/colanic/teichoic acid biosynthesis glycosyltransferase